MPTTTLPAPDGGPTEIAAQLSDATAVAPKKYQIELHDGRKLRIEADDQEAALAGAQHFLDNNPVAANTSLARALPAGAAGLISGFGSTLQNYGAPNAGAALERTAASIAPRNYESAGERVLHPQAGDSTVFGYGVGSLPRAALESFPGMAADLAAAKVGAMVGARVPGGALAKIIGAAVGGVGSYMARSTGNEAEARAEKRTGDASATPTPEDKTVAALSTATQGAIGQLTLNRFLSPGRVAGVGAKGVTEAAGKYLGTVGTAGGTSAAQNAVSQAGQTVGTPGGTDVDTHQLGGAALTGAATGGLLGIPRVARDAVQATRFRDLRELSEPSSSVANRILAKMDDPSDLQNTKTAYHATADTTYDVLNELKTVHRALDKTALTPEANNALSRAVKGGGVSDADLAAITDGTRNTTGADQIRNLVSQAAVLARLKAQGSFDDGREKFSGGSADAVRSVVARHPLIAATAGGAGVTGTLGGLGQLLAAPLILAKFAAAGGAAYAGAHVVDRALGLASPARSFVDKFRDASIPVRTPQAVAVRPLGPMGTSGVPAVSMPPAPPWGYPAAAMARTGPSGAQASPVPLRPEGIIDDGVASIVKRAQATAGARARADKDGAAVTDPLSGIRLIAKARASVPPESVATEQSSTGNGSHVEEMPTPEGLLHTKVSRMDLHIAENATHDFKRASNPPEVIASRYHDSTAQRQARIRDRLMAVSGDPAFPSDDVALGAALDKVRHVRTREGLDAYVHQLASSASPEVGALIRKYFGPRWGESVWNATRQTKR